METNIIYNEDCLEGMKKLPDGSVDMLLTDIPYGEVNRTTESGLRKLKKGDADIVSFKLSEFLDEVYRIVSGSFYIFCGIEQISPIRKYFRKKDLLTRNFVWNKNNPSPINGQYNWLSSIENGVYAKKKGATFNRHCKGVVFKYPVGSSKIHPTQKPLKLFDELLLASSNEGDIVLDPFIGSGTTAVSALKNNRKFIGYEINKEYYNIALKRIGKFDKEYYNLLPKEERPAQLQMF